MDLAMASSEVLKAPRYPELPAPPSDGFWTETQWAVLMAIMDTIVPSIVSKSCLTDRHGQLGVPDTEFLAASKTARDAVVEVPEEDEKKGALVAAYLEDRPSTNLAIRAATIRLLAHLPVDQQEGLGLVYSSSLGAFLLTGYCTPFHQQPAHIRESIVQGWHNAWLPTMRKVSRSLVKIAQVCWLSASPLFRDVTGYPDVPVNWKPTSSFDFQFLQFPAAAAAEEDDDSTEDTKTHWGQHPQSKQRRQVTIDTDVVIVGSGCGGAVAAKVLAEAGHRVVVVDKGYHFPSSMLPMTAAAASRYLFDGGVSGSVDKSVGISAGSTWGGGGTVNWSVSLQTQAYVRKEWAAGAADADARLGFFDGPAYQDCMDRVCARMGVATAPVAQSHRGRVLLDGSRKLGWRAGVCPQNSGGAEHACGHCTLGCGSNEKMGPAACWLPDAARAGAEFVEGFEVERVVLENGRATGVLGTWTSRDAKGGLDGPSEERLQTEVMITAKRVIVACGALRSPLLLQNSGLKNPHIGHNLHLHPCYMVGSFFREDTRPWEGAIISSYCSEFEDLDNKGHGVKLETTSMTPFTCYFPRPWRGGLDFKLATLRYRHMAAYISVTRDRDSGRVYADPITGDLQIDYTPSVFDRAHALEGALALCKILYVTGAREIDPYIQGLDPFTRDDSELEQQRRQPQQQQAEKSSSNGSSSSSSQRDQDGDEKDRDGKEGYDIKDPRFLAWTARARRLAANPENVSSSSAHQMSTCRMSATEDQGVVDVRGKVWGTQGLYVADSSVFPSASGVNPMVTVMAIADWIARAVDEDLKGEKA